MPSSSGSGIRVALTITVSETLATASATVSGEDWGKEKSTVAGSKPGAKTCYECNIFDTRPDPSYGTGAIVNVAKVSPMPKAGNQWNTYDITAKGTHLVVVLNGVTTADVNDSRHAEGPFALQYAGGAIKFRKVQIRPL